MNSLHLVLFFVSLVLAGLFCSVETAFVGVQKLRILHLVRTGSRQAARVQRIIEHPAKFLATVLFGINFFETAMAALGTVMAVSFWGENLGAALATIVLTVVTLVVVEIIPKNLAARYGEAMTLRLVRFVEVTALVLYPFVWVLSRIGLGFQRLGRGPEVKRPTMSAEEMRTAISVGEAEGVLDEDEADMLAEVFRFRERTVREIMVPRTQTVWVRKGTTIGDFVATYSEHPYTRFPVYEGEKDTVVGILAIKDVLVAQAGKGCEKGALVDGLLRPAYFVPMSKHLGDLLAEMRQGNHHLAIVVSEFGGVAGVVTMEQLVEEIVGDMGDELARDGKDIVPLDEWTFRLDGALRVEEANGQLGLDLPRGEYATIAGFIMSHLGRIPKEGETLKYRSLRMTISRMDGLKVEEVLLAKEKNAAPAA